MAIVLIEEVLMGLDDVRSSLDQAAVTLENIIEDMLPDLMPGLQEDLERDFLHPLQTRVTALETLLDKLANNTPYGAQSLADDFDDPLADALDDLDNM